jgi:hypothetical protein
MLVNVFDSDLFSFTSLTSAVNKVPYVPRGLSQWLPWNAQGVNTISVVVEEREGVLSLVPTAPRGAPASQEKRAARKARSFLVPHYPREATILAAEVQGVRQFGSEDAMETVEQKRDERLADMARSHQATWEYARAGAISGKLLDADGSVIYDWHAEFGVAQNTKTIALDTATTKVVNKLIEAKEASEDELGELIADGYVLVCGKSIFHDFVGHPTIEKAYERWQDGAALRDDNRRGFKIASDITVVSYNRGKVGSTKFIADDEAYLCPVAEGLYQTRYAPADTIEAANTVGLPLYSSAEPLRHGKGVELHTESNHLSYVTRPRAIVKITKS